jgi:hypothetical protein
MFHENKKVNLTETIAYEFLDEGYVVELLDKSSCYNKNLMCFHAY